MTRNRTFLWLAMALILVVGNTALLLWLQGPGGTSSSGNRRPSPAPRERVAPLREPTAAEAATLAKAADAAAVSRLRVEVVDGAGLPLAGASLRVHADRRAVRSPFAEPLLAEGVTGADGTAELTVPPRARYRVEASLAGRPTVAAAGADLVRLRLPMPAAILGRVVEDGGAPVPGVEVALLPPAVTTGRFARPDLPRVPVAEAVAVSAEDGTFAFRGLAPGPRSVRARVLVQFPQGFGTAVDVPEGEVVRVEVVLARRTDVPGRVIFAGSDKPVSGGSIRIAQTDYAVGTRDCFEEAPLDADGRFLLHGIPLGEPLHGTVTTAEGLRIAARLPRTAFAPGGGIANEVTVVLPWNTPADLDYRGRIVDARGRPVAGVRVIVGTQLPWKVPLRDGGGHPDFRETATGADGRYAVQGLGYRAGEILVLHPDFAPGYFRLPSRSRNRVFDFTLPDAAELLVRVRDAAGRPLPGVEVRALLRYADAFDNLSGNFGDLLDGLRANPVTDAQGTARVSGFGPGSWFLAARSADEKLCGRVLVEADGIGSKAIDLVLAEAPSIEGRVVDTEGKPVPGAVVALLDGFLSGSRVRSTDAEGRFAFPGAAASPMPDIGVPPGRVRLFLDFDARFRPAPPAQEYLDAEPGAPVEFRVERATPR